MTQEGATRSGVTDRQAYCARYHGKPLPKSKRSRDAVQMSFTIADTLDSWQLSMLRSTKPTRKPPCTMAAQTLHASGTPRPAVVASRTTNFLEMSNLAWLSGLKYLLYSTPITFGPPVPIAAFLLEKPNLLPSFVLAAADFTKPLRLPRVTVTLQYFPPGALSFFQFGLGNHGQR